MRLRYVLLPVAVIAFALAGFGCGGGDSDETTAAAADVSTAATTAEVETEDVETEDVSATAEDDTTEPSTVAGAVPASEWLGTVCGAISSWQDELVGGTADLQQASDPAEAKQLVGDYLQDVVDATDAMIDEIASAGAPDVAQGEEIAAGFQTALGSLRDSFADARSEVDSLPTDDPQALGQALENLGSSLASAGDEAGATFDQLAQDYPDSGLDEAAANEPACAGIVD
jgi:hypothetical protein